MEMNPIFMEICENVNTKQSNLQIRCSPYQNPHGVFFHRNIKTDHKIHMESQGTLNSQNCLDEKKKARDPTF